MHEIKTPDSAPFAAVAVPCPHVVAKVERRAKSGKARFHVASPSIASSPVEALRHALLPFSARRQDMLEKLLLVASDLVALFCGFLLGRAAPWAYGDASLIDSFTLWWSQSGPTRLVVFSAIAAGLVMWFWGALGHYTRRRPWSDEVRQMLQVLLAGFVLDAMLVFLGKWQFSRLWLVTSWAMILVLVPLFRYLVKRWMLARPAFQRPYLIIGSCEQAGEVVAAFESERLMGMRPVAVVSPSLPDCQQRNCPVHGAVLPVIHLDAAVENFLKAPGAYQVVIALGRQDELLKRLIQRLTLVRDDVFLIPPLAGLPLYGMELSHFFSHEVLLLRARNNLNRRGTRAVKRVFDIVGASLLMILLAPLLIAIPIFIKRENDGPAMFSQPRVGRGGRDFRFLKYRSMVVDADRVLEKWQVAHPELWQRYRANNFKLVDDPRVTRVGAWIRRTSIDELPQLWNVVRGDMSLVGPRPLLPRELAEYGESIELYANVRPGITGLWQISGRSATTFDQRIALDRWYIRNWSLWSDLVILIRTVRVVLRSEGAC
ncbi:undecaprenyl-phosphate galactose phosphotransferase WbaP [Azoarcus sp. PA01]|nr:undecaprenyl-phosphate galactose phosphotransferase WbaP [Azoarcus sp. PA01]